MEWYRVWVKPVRVAELSGNQNHIVTQTEHEQQQRRRRRTPEKAKKKKNDSNRRNGRRREMASRRHRRYSTQRILHDSCIGNSFYFVQNQISLNLNPKTLNFSKNWDVTLFDFFFQDSDNLREALKYSALLLSELRTSKLSPHKYYELCKFFSLLKFFQFQFVWLFLLMKSGFD